MTKKLNKKSKLSNNKKNINKEEKNKIKDNIFNDKRNLYFYSLILFIITSIILKNIPIDIGNTITYLIFPLYFFMATILHIKYCKITYNFPIALTIMYLIIGYLLIGNIISPLKIIIAYLSSLIPLIFITILYKIKNKKLNIEEIEDKDEESKLTTSNLLPIIFIVVLELYFTIATFGVMHLPSAFSSLLLGIILTYSIYYILLLIFRRTKITLIVFSLIFLILFIINEGRIYYTSDTLQLTDVIFLQNAGEVAGFADVTLINCLNFLMWPTILVVIIYYYLFKVVKRNNVKIDNIGGLVKKAIISFIVLTILILPTGIVDKFMTENIFNIYDKGDLAITASNTRYYYRYGVLPSFYGKLIEQRRYTPNNYDEKELKNELDSAERIESTWNKPNIIVVFSESFWDLSKLDKIMFDKDVTPNFHRLKEEQKSIEMISPAYGGISSNVEFEILTGGSLNYFSKGYTPYMQLFKKGVSDNNPNLITELKNNGYKTKILNSSSKNMFNCSIVYDIYGVDEVNHLFDEVDLGGNYVTDEYLTDRLIEYFNNKPESEKIFYFLITMGGHMPYFEGRYDDYDINIVESPYDKDTNEVIHSYAEGMYLADKELGRIYDYINTLDEDTIVVFFGDHLPHLSTPDGKDALFTTDFLNDDYNLDSVYKQYNTTALILSNYDINYDDTKYLSPDLLLTYVVNNMDLELSSYYKWLYSTKDSLPSSNFVVSQDNDGKIYYTLDLEGKMKDTYELRKKMQYMLFK